MRWWATDASLVDALTNRSPESCVYASERLGIILDSYTVYLDIWVADSSGRIIASGRPGTFGRVIGANVANEPWFKRAMLHSSGDQYFAGQVTAEPLLNDSQTCAFSAAVRSKAGKQTPVIGVIGIFFDWRNQADSVRVRSFSFCFYQLLMAAVGCLSMNEENTKLGYSCPLIE